MAAQFEKLRAFLAQPALALVEVVEALGSTPREAGAWMVVSPDAIFGTIGGGQLEFMAIDRAREMLGAGNARRRDDLPSRGNLPPPLTPPLRGEGGANSGAPRSDGAKASESSSPLRGGVRGGGIQPDGPTSGEGETTHLSIPLGPEIGQCCGGRVELSITVMDQAARDILLAQAEREDAVLPQVYLFGGGHVGRALAAALALLPVHATVVETRADELEGLPDGVEAHLTAMPEGVVREAPDGSAFIVLTHDHALDFLIVAETLKRPDAAYIGMIGSKTKRATFNSWYLKTADGAEADLARLVSPIGGKTVNDKRPAVIAALVAAEVVTALAGAPEKGAP